MNTETKQTILCAVILFSLICIATSFAIAAGGAPEMSPVAKQVDHDKNLFRPDPSYGDRSYNPEEQLIIYGGKHKVKTPRPLFEIGDRLYWDGPIKDSGSFFGEKNPNAFWLMAFGDWRTAVGYNRLNDHQKGGVLATTINFDIDMRLTATERIHATMSPLEQDNQFTRVNFGIPGQDAKGTAEGDADVDRLYFEGDFGPLFAGMTGKYNGLDLPFSVGLVPLFTQNGIWLDDAFTGFAITPFSAKTSPKLNISNYDITFFAGFRKITSAAFARNTILKPLGIDEDPEDNTRMFGVFGFADANRGYWEYGYGYVDSDFDGGSYHNLTISHTRRIRHHLSNSVRLIANVGQEGILDQITGERKKSANGVLLLIENSLITSKPSTLVPYFNFFAGFDHPQSLARAANAGFVLKNTGLLFEGDTLTQLPFLDATANNTVGGALGVEYLFNLNQQLVVEGGAVITHGDDADRVVQGNQYGFDVRYQRPITNAWIIRSDAMFGFLDNVDKDKDGHNDKIFGIRLEMRRKF